MTVARSVEDRLRAEYFALLPEIRLVVAELETELRHALLPISLSLKHHERVLVNSRVKECESAVDALRRRQEGGIFDSQRNEALSLSTLNDLAGARVLAFPSARVREVHQVLLKRFPDWVTDPIPGFREDDAPLAQKYHGMCMASERVRGEFQVVPLLVGLFWEVEHAAIYKPAPNLKGVASSLAMRERTRTVLEALRDFEMEFERQIEDAT